MSSRSCCGGRRIVDQGLIDGVGDSSFETPHGLSSGFPFTLFAQEVLAAMVIGPGLGNGRDVNRPVELPVSTASQPMTLSAPGRGRQWGRAVRGRELCLGFEPAHV